MATFPSKVNYATGDILTATNMNDVGGAINLLDGAQFAAGKNRVLNSNFSVWQRGTSFSFAASTSYANGYNADRWDTQTYANQAVTVSRQATGDTTNLPNIQYCLRYQRNSGQTGTTILGLGQSFESSNSIPLAGKTVTLSFYARAGSNFSAASSAFIGTIYSGTGTDQNIVSGYTGVAQVASTTATLTTTWQRFTVSGTVAATATELAVYFAYTPVGTASTNDYYEITGVQLEAANTASPYAPNSSTYQGELAACQRYYWRNTGGATFSTLGAGFGLSTTSATFIIQSPVQMRITPTVLEFSTLRVTEFISTSAAITAMTISAESSPLVSRLNADVASGLTKGVPYGITANSSATAYLGLSAEL
jgi:hypothetical protein